MGTCSSGPQESEEDKAQKKKSKELEKMLSQDQQKEAQVNKLLLLGAGESGKSTLFKQMVLIHGKGYNEAERKNFIGIIHGNIISSMKTLCQWSDRLREEPFNLSNTAVADQLIPSKNWVLEVKHNDESAIITLDVAAHIHALWNDPGIRETFRNRSKFQLIDSAKYFFDKVKTIAQPTYIPDKQDVLHSRTRTTGIVEQEFIIDNNVFKMFDVGGQRNERKKWIHCFSEVTAVLFIAAISEYDQVLFEDETTNRMAEALTLFEEIANSQWFKKTSMILFLNKVDLFLEKIREVPLSEDVFPTLAMYMAENGNPQPGSNDYAEAAISFMKEIFSSLQKSKGKALYVHTTCATDTENMRVVFNAVKDIVIRKSLQEGGLLM